VNYLPSSDSIRNNGFYFQVMKVFCSFFLMCFTVLSVSITNAQVKYKFAKDTVEINGGGTFSNQLRVSNPYPGRIVLVQRNKNFYKGLIALPDSLVLEAFEKRTFPLKYIADRNTVKSNLQLFELDLVSHKPGVSVQQSARFYTQLTDVGGITLGTEDNEVYLSQTTNQAQVVVRCANNGFVPVTLRLLLSGIPDGLEFTGQTMNFTLQPGAQQLLPFLARNKTGIRNASDFTVTIRAMDGSNHELASKIVRIISVTSARRMGRNNEMSGTILPNSAALRYASNSTNSSFYQLQSNARIRLGAESSLEYSINADQYVQANVKGLTVYNTYADLQTKYVGLKVGNIYENIDFNLGGRGLRANINHIGGGRLSFYGIENIYQLVNQIGLNAPAARVYALDYSLPGIGSGERRITAVHSKDPYTGIDVNQASAKSFFNLSAQQVLGFEAGYSREKEIGAGNASEPGFSAGLNYALTTEAIQVSMNGYYGSPYFTGLRRGLLQSDLRLLHSIGKSSSVLAHVNILASSPKYLSQLNNPYNYGINKNAVYMYELGFATSIGKANININPYYMDQGLVTNNVVNMIADHKDWRSASVRLNTGINYSSGLQNISLNADYGYTYINSSERPPAPYHSLKLNATYNLPVIGVNAYMQFNPFYLTDALSVTEHKKYSLYAVGPNVRFSALKSALSIQANAMFNYYGFTRSTNYTATGNIRYFLGNHWAITGDMQYTVTKQMPIIQVDAATIAASGMTENLYYNNRQFRIGIEKQFGSTQKESMKKLELTYFEDHNSNGLKDHGEPVVGGVLVKINGEVALTNSKGIVQFDNMKKEAYKVSITNTKGWSLPEPTEVFLDKNKQIHVALVKTQALNGCIKVKSDKYMKDDIQLAGIRITAADENGRLYQTMTDGKGDFCFFLPRNKYTVYIETKGMPFSIENGKEEVLLQGKPVGLLTFLYRDEHRKVGVTKFD
jgi:hypothetical protein